MLKQTLEDAQLELEYELAQHFWNNSLTDDIKVVLTAIRELRETLEAQLEEA